MKLKIFSIIRIVALIVLTSAFALYYFLNVYPALKQCYSIDIELAPGIESTINVLQINSLILAEIYFYLLFSTGTIINMVFSGSRKRVIKGIIQLTVLFIVCFLACVFMFINRANLEYKTLSYTVSVIGFVLQIVTVLFRKPKVSSSKK